MTMPEFYNLNPLTVIDRSLKFCSPRYCGKKNAHQNIWSDEEIIFFYREIKKPRKVKFRKIEIRFFCKLRKNVRRKKFFFVELLQHFKKYLIENTDFFKKNKKINHKNQTISLKSAANCFTKSVTYKNFITIFDNGMSALFFLHFAINYLQFDIVLIFGKVSLDLSRGGLLLQFYYFQFLQVLS